VISVLCIDHCTNIDWHTAITSLDYVLFLPKTNVSDEYYCKFIRSGSGSSVFLNFDPDPGGQKNLNYFLLYMNKTSGSNW
jgi:hypothetical protein